MIVTKTPLDYQAAFSELIYTIDNASAAQKIDVLVYDSAQANTIGIKRLTGETKYTVNVASYLQRQFDINPLICPICSVIREPSRLKSASIKVGELANTPKTWHTFGALDARPYTKLSDSPKIQKIAPSQRDEISFIAPDGLIEVTIELSGVDKSCSLYPSSVNADHNIHSVMVEMVDIEHEIGEEGYRLEDFSRINVSICADGSEFINQQYQIVPRGMSTVRFCWINRYGVIDYYSARSRRSKVAKVENSTIYSKEGYKNIGSQTEFCSTVISEYEPEATMEWLCELIAAPKVWIVEGNSYTPVNVKSQTTTIASSELARMELSVSPIKHGFSQKN